MALPTGAISLSQVNQELDRTATDPISLSDDSLRDLANDTSGAISMSSLQGKSKQIEATGG